MALDLSVLGGDTRVGYRVHSRSRTPLPRIEGKVVLITGATSGVGPAAADGSARLGATVWLAVRNRQRGERARAGLVPGATGFISRPDWLRTALRRAVGRDPELLAA